MSVKRINCCVETKPCEKPFPKLMIHMNGSTIALVGKDFRATILVKGGSAGVGEKLAGSLDVILRYWKDYNEPLTLQNE